MNYKELEIQTSLDTLKKRAEITKAIRNFLDQNEFLEVETPVISSHLIPEANIEIFTTQYETIRENMPCYLTPSPEIWMKQIIAQYKQSIFQITKSFRNCEAVSPLHNPEFTMLEYYAVEKDYIDSMNLTKSLLDYIALKTNNSKIKYHEISLNTIFKEKTQMEIPQAADKEYLTKAWNNTQSAKDQACFDFSQYSAYDIFDLIFVTEIEPEMQNYQAAFLLDFPAFLPTTADIAPNPRFSQRWELYLDGVEIANCYTEKTSQKDMEKYYKAEERRKAQTTERTHAVNHGYCQIFKDFPMCSGTALGLDRLVMFFLEKKDIKDVIVKPFSSLLIGKDV